MNERQRIVTKTIIAFDLGRSPYTGVSIWENNELVLYKKVCLKDLSIFDIYAKFLDIINAFHKCENCIVVYEENRHVPNGINAMLSQMELRTILECACFANRVFNIVKFKPINWRKIALSNYSNLTKLHREQFKQIAVLEANRVIGRNELNYFKDKTKTDDDIAEAILIGLVAKLKYGN